MNKIFIQELALENYRNFLNFEIKIANTPIILVGENGSGKTNILEALSLFFPGKGIRSAKLVDICNREVGNTAVHISMESKIGPAQISTYFTRDSNRRLTEFNKAKIQNNELSKFVNMVWLTPQMEGIFAGGASERRKFLDRIVYNFIPTHAKIVSEYEHYIYERIKTLESDNLDKNWLNTIEEKIAELSIKIAENRLQIVKNIQEAIDNIDNHFPKALLKIEGMVEQKILEKEADVCNFIKAQFYAMRNRDKLLGRTNFGVHKSDFIVIHKEKKVLARLCSTGEQKAMLIMLILAQVNYSINAGLAKPILLLDEVFVHLDEKRREYLTEFFITLGLQLWITTTDLGEISRLAANSQLIKL